MWIMITIVIVAALLAVASIRYSRHNGMGRSQVPYDHETRKKHGGGAGPPGGVIG